MSYEFKPILLCVLGVHLKEATDAINKLVDESIGKTIYFNKL